MPSYRTIAVVICVLSSPILGAEQPEHVAEAFAALAWHLPPEERRVLDEVSAVEMPAKWA